MHSMHLPHVHIYSSIQTYYDAMGRKNGNEIQFFFPVLLLGFHGCWKSFSNQKKKPHIFLFSKTLYSQILDLSDYGHCMWRLNLFLSDNGPIKVLFFPEKKKKHSRKKVNLNRYVLYAAVHVETFNIFYQKLLIILTEAIFQLIKMK